jgi:hypothetical protein
MSLISTIDYRFSPIWAYKVLTHTIPIVNQFGSVSGYIFLYHTELNRVETSFANEKKKRSEDECKISKANSATGLPIHARHKACQSTKQ